MVKDAPFWTLHPAGCDDVLIDRIRILNDLDVANSDGIDPDHCSKRAHFGLPCQPAPMIAFCLKTSKGNSEYGPTENVIIDGCTLVSTSAAIKIGTEALAISKTSLFQIAPSAAQTEAFPFKSETAVMLKMFPIQTLLSKRAAFAPIGGERQSR